MKENKKWYRIQQVANKTGLSPQLIRKWEERYHAVEPRRLENGYRVYHENDIDRLLALKALVEDGYTIGNAVLYLQESSSVTDTGLETHIESMESGTAGRIETPSVLIGHMETDVDSAEAAPAIRELLEAGTESNTARMKLVLHKTYSLKGLHFTVNGVIMPFLREVGQLWENGTWSEYQEHIASLEIRDFLVHTRSLIAEPVVGPRLLAACVPGEHHEIMIRVVLLEAAIRGWRTSFLGATPSGKGLADAIERLKPSVVVLSATTLEPFRHHVGLVAELESLAAAWPDVHMYIGGPADIGEAIGSVRGIEWVNSAQDLFQRIEHGDTGS